MVIHIFECENNWVWSDRFGPVRGLYFRAPLLTLKFQKKESIIRLKRWLVPNEKALQERIDVHTNTDKATFFLPPLHTSQCRFIPFSLFECFRHFHIEALRQWLLCQHVCVTCSRRLFFYRYRSIHIKFKEKSFHHKNTQEAGPNPAAVSMAEPIEGMW